MSIPPWQHLICTGQGLEAEKLHSEFLDTHLGLECARIEHELICRARQRSNSEDYRDWGPALHGRDLQTWVGLPLQSLMTPYAELLRIVERLSPPAGSTLTDLGAGYGRLGYITSLRFPGVRTLGYEFVPERVAEGRRIFGALTGTEFQLQVADLSSPGFALPCAHAHFLYDTGSHSTIRSLIAQIQTHARSQPVRVVGRGRATRHLIETENPWLSQVIPPEQHDTFTIYRSE
jgi:hypothetical protein